MNMDSILSNLQNFTVGMNDEAWGVGASKSLLAKGGQSRMLINYIEMMEKNPVNDVDFKKQIRTLVNVPKFLRDVLGFGNSETIFHLLNEYMRMHVCQNEGCDNLTELKCSICKISKYCSRACQTKDFENHKPDCSRMGALERKGRHAGKGAQVYLEKNLGVQIVSFRVFYDEIMMRAYEAFLYFFQKHKSNISYNQMKNFARRKENLTSLRKITSDMKNSYGPQNWLQEVENRVATVAEIFGLWLQDVDVQRDERGNPLGVELLSTAKLNRSREMVYRANVSM